MSSSSSSSAAAKTKLVIVGAGYVASSILLALKKTKNFEITLIDAKDYFDFNLASPRVLVELPVGESTIVNHSEWVKNFPSAKFVQGFVTKVSPSENSVTLADGTTIPYDFLVIGTGSTYEAGDFKANSRQTSRQARLEAFARVHEKVKAAKRILIVGGGPVGVEFAGEIVTDFPDKKVTLVHRGSHLLNHIFNTSKPGELAAAFLASKNVTVVLDDSVAKDKIDAAAASLPATLATEKGVTIEADAVFWAVPERTIGGSKLLQESLPGAIDPQTKEILVDDFLRVQGASNIFAAGDVAKIELKAAHLAEAQGAHVAKNLIEQTKKKPSPLKAYTKTTKRIGLVSVGRGYGVGVLPLFGVVKGGMPTSIKSKKMFVNFLPSKLGLK